MTELYPYKLHGVTKSPIWGGTRLLKDWNKTSDEATIGESWELTVRKSEKSIVCNGALAGKTVEEVLTLDPCAIMGTTAMQNGEFPLLVKLLDAGDRLSVQVHPDDDYAARVENDRGKTEMWYIVEADEGAEIICGLADGVSAEDYANAVASGSPEAALKHQPVQPGETYFIPSGLPHAIGKGILIAEIQQNCDLTYRVYDYNRRDKNGNLRELHVEKALDVIRPFSNEEIERIRYANCTEKKDQHLLADCVYFRVERMELTEATRTIATNGYLCHLLCLGGTADLCGEGYIEQIQKGDSVLLPAALNQTEIHGTGTFLLTTAY